MPILLGGFSFLLILLPYLFAFVGPFINFSKRARWKTVALGFGTASLLVVAALGAMWDMGLFLGYWIWASGVSMTVLGAWLEFKDRGVPVVVENSAAV